MRDTTLLVGLLGLIFLAAGCSVTLENDPSTGPGGAGSGTAGAPGGGAGATGGVTGDATGGAAGDATGGATGDATGGATGDASGGGQGGPDPADIPTCEEYCELIMTVCTGDNQQYPSKLACVAYCEDWAGIPPGTSDDKDANTIGCRLYHATVASASAPESHCFHAGPSGAGHCGPLCQTYCQLSQRNCTGPNALWPSMIDCLNACEPWNDGAAGDEAGNSKECRIHWLGLAGTEPPGSADAHCSKASVDGGGVCVADGCTPECAAGAQCGPDGCGGSCGTCGAGSTCQADKCVAGCEPTCSAAAQCGPDGCGGTCGDCAAGESCKVDQCVSDCVPSCAPGAQCGPDGCGGSCGECSGGLSCKEDQCVTECVPACPTEAECGGDGCGGSCGSCPSGSICQAKKCVAPCAPSCGADIECGPDGCGGSCGTCSGGLGCVAGKCTTDCVPYCAPANECGSDGCGGSCGACGAGLSCVGKKCVAAPCGPITYEGCCDGTLLKYCNNTALTQQDCASQPCGWDPTSNFYTCGKTGADPSGTHPIACPAP